MAPAVVDNSADPATNFFALLLALFPPGMPPPQPLAVESSDTLSESPATGMGQAAGVKMFPPDELLAEENHEEAISLEQPLVLSVLAPFLWGNTPPITETSLAAQAGSQSSSPLLPVTVSAPVVRTQGAERGGQKPNSGEAEGTVLTLSPTPTPIDGDTVVPAAARAVGEQTRENRGTPLQPGASEKPNVKVEEREALVRRFTALDPSAQRRDWVSLSQLAPVVSGEHASPPSRPSVEPQPSERGEYAEAGNPLLLVDHDAGDASASQAARENFVPAPVLKKEPSHPEFVAVDQSGAKPASSLQNDQLSAEFASPGKARIDALQTTRPLSNAETLTPTVLGNSLPAAPTLQPERSTHLGNLESWREVVNQVSDGILATIEQNNHEARLQLEPPELGKLDIQLVMEGEHLRAHIVTESADVGALIQTHLAELKQALQGHRLDLDTVRIEVHPGGGEPFMSSQNPHPETRQHHQRGKQVSTHATELDPAVGPTTPLGDHRGRVNVWA